MRRKPGGGLVSGEMNAENNVEEERKKLGIMICVEELMEVGGEMDEIGWGRCGEGRQEI